MVQVGMFALSKRGTKGYQNKHFGHPFTGTKTIERVPKGAAQYSILKANAKTGHLSHSQKVEIVTSNRRTILHQYTVSISE